MGLYDSYDLDWTWDGDYTVGKDGDIKDTREDAIKSLVTEVRTIVRSEMGDWKLYPTLGANLSDFIGEPNFQDNAKKVEERIMSALISSDVVLRGDVDVKAVPIQPSVLFIIITIFATATADNSLQSDSPVTVSLLYDTVEDSVFFTSENIPERLARS